MGVIITAECQECEDINKFEFNGGVIVIGFNDKDGEKSILLWKHEICPPSDMLELLIEALNYTKEDMKKLEANVNRQ